MREKQNANANDRIQIELENPDREWEIVNAWFVRQKNMDIKLSRR